MKPAATVPIVGVLAIIGVDLLVHLSKMLLVQSWALYLASLASRERRAQG